ncbi:MAG: PhzF family phenazine biosynthesis protein [Agriterribacter sp.]
MQIKTYFVDAFTNEIFKGNPAAICVIENELADTVMQNIAFEIGFSETAFTRHDSENNFKIRFFTPKKEIPLCGHATLAASKIIFETSSLTGISFLNIEDTIFFTEKSGSQIKMEFPVYGTENIAVPEIMLNALGIKAINASVYNKHLDIIVIEIDSIDDLRKLEPDFAALIKSYTGINGVLITAKANRDEFDFHYRYFWPWSGTDEDPVTGAVQTFLTKYWADRLNTTMLESFQSSKRTGRMKTELANDKVFIYGEAVIVMEAILKVN